MLRVFEIDTIRGVDNVGEQELLSIVETVEVKPQRIHRAKELDKVRPFVKSLY